MKDRLIAGLCISLLFVAAASPALALANRVFASARSGNNANACDNINTPCQTLAGALTQLNPDGEVIVLDSGGYGPVTITQGVTIEAPAGVTAFIHPPSGAAITVNAGSGIVTLRGLVLNQGSGDGITVLAVGTLNVENCFIAGFPGNGIRVLVPGRLSMKGTDIKACGAGVRVVNTTGAVRTTIDHCHLDGNSIGFFSGSTSPASSTTTATYTTANGNNNAWICGDGSSGTDVLNLEFCTASENLNWGMFGNSTNASSAIRYSNCVVTNNGNTGVVRNGAALVESRANSTLTGNAGGNTFGSIGTIPPL